MAQSERDFAIRLANTVLDNASRDPDDDLSVLARQFLRALEWLPMSSAPKDGTAFLAYGKHTHSPPDAQRGVKAGDHWWAIILWDVWREPQQFVFSKDGAPVWSEPQCWRPLLAPLREHEREGTR